MHKFTITTAPRELNVIPRRGKTFRLIEVKDIVKYVKADVKISPEYQNCSLTYGRVAGAISKAAGPKFREEMKRLLDEQNEKTGKSIMPVGSATFIEVEKNRQKRLGAEYVSLAVCIQTERGMELFSTEKWVAESLLNTLKEADKRKLKSVALPLMGTSLHLLPIETAVQVITKTSVEFLEKAKSIEDIILVALPDAFDKAKKTIFPAA